MRRPPMRRMAYAVPADLGERVDAALEKIRRDSTPRAHAGELAEVIVDLTHEGLKAYFLTPLARVDVGMLTMGSARVGVAAAEKSLPTWLESSKIF